MGQVITPVRDEYAAHVAELRAEYARCMRESERDPAVFRVRVELYMRSSGLKAGPEGYAVAARGVQLVHLSCSGAGCARCSGRGWHSGTRPLTTE